MSSRWNSDNHGNFKVMMSVKNVKIPVLIVIWHEAMLSTGTKVTDTAYTIVICSLHL